MDNQPNIVNVDYGDDEDYVTDEDNEDEYEDDYDGYDEDDDDDDEFERSIRLPYGPEINSRRLHYSEHVTRL